MNIKLIIYAISILSSTFAISGININNIFKKNHVWEARIFTILLIFGLSYLVSSFFITFLNI